MENGEKRKRILLVLTDASPQDDQDSGEGAFYKNKESDSACDSRYCKRSAESGNKKEWNFLGSAGRKQAKSDKDEISVRWVFAQYIEI